MKFKPGQQVVCIDNRCDNHLVISPKLHEVVTVAGPGFHLRVRGIIRLTEYLRARNGRMQSFYESQFEPLVSDEVLYNELNEITVTI